MNSLQNLITKNKVYTKIQIPFTNHYLIKWNPKSNTDIHDHHGKQCDFRMIFGTLHEVRFKKNSIGSLYHSQKIKMFQKNHINDTMGYHQVFNFDNMSKISIHKYYE